MAKAPLFPRRRPRTPSATERRVGAVLLALLGLIFVLFFVAGSRPGPLTRAATSGEEGSSSKRMFPLLSPGTWPVGSVEHYDEASLFEKINGKADAYLAYDFAALHFASYGNPARDEDFVDVYVYEMKSPLDAFGVYRAGRTGKEAQLEAGDEAVQRDEAIFFREGPYLVEVFASGPSARDEARALALGLASGLAVDSAPIPVPDGLASPTLEIIQYARRSALGVEGLDDAFIALHDDGAKLLLATFANEATAEKIAARAREDLAFLGQPFTLAREGTRIRIATGADDARREALLADLDRATDEETR